MKFETPRTNPGAEAGKAADPAMGSQTNLRKVSRLKPAKLSAGPKGSLTRPRGTRKSVTERPAVPVVILPTDEVAEGSSVDSSLNSMPRGDNLQLYLREIGQVQLLTPEQEIELAKRIQKGDDEAREHMI